MTTIFTIILLLTNIIFYIIIFDVILSWLQLFGIKFRPKFIADIIDPLYKSIKKVIPTIFGPFEFAPLIVIFILMLIQQLIYAYDPEMILYYKELFKF